MCFNVIFTLLREFLEAGAAFEFPDADWLALNCKNFVKYDFFILLPLTER